MASPAANVARPQHQSANLHFWAYSAVDDDIAAWNTLAAVKALKPEGSSTSIDIVDVRRLDAEPAQCRKIPSADTQRVERYVNEVAITGGTRYM